MKIAICLRRVPDTTAKIAIAANGTSIDETGVKFVPNPYDEYALEAGIALRDAAGAGETVVIAFGGDAVQETMRTALAMGAAKAVLVSDDALAGTDALGTAKVLAKAIERAGAADLILTATESSDGYTGVVPEQIAELLSAMRLPVRR